MDTIIIVFIIWMAIIIWWLIWTEVHNHRIEKSNNRQLKRYRYKENCEMIPKGWKKYIHTEKYFIWDVKSLDDFRFVFEYKSFWPQGEWIKFKLAWPIVTAEHDDMIHRFKEIKAWQDSEFEPYIMNYH